jgi:hypothetical protein
MKAKRVPINAVVFDFDETLVKTKAKIYVYKNRKLIKSLDSHEYNFYKKKPDETLDFSDFNDPLLVLKATKFKIWPVLEKIYFNNLSGQSSTDIYILTARESTVKASIYTYLKRNHIIIPEDHIITVGDDYNLNNPIKKKQVLKDLKQHYQSIMFYDDNANTINLAGEIGGITTVLVDCEIKK